MKHVVVHFIDLKMWTLEQLLNSQYLKYTDLSVFDKYKCEEIKKQKIASTILKNKFIKNYYIGENGKPLSDHIYFNVSHSKDLVALVQDDKPIGLDIEQIRTASDDIKRYISTDEEYEYIKDDKSFFEIWTNKEALSKCIGVGLTKRVKEIPALPINDKKEYLNKVFSCRTIEFHGYVVSIALEGDLEYQILTGTSYI